MFIKQLLRPLRWLQRNRLESENLLRMSYSADASKLFLEKILASPGPESKLPDGMYTEFKDMDPEMQEMFKKVIQCEYKVQRLKTFNQIGDWITDDMMKQLYHTRCVNDRHRLMNTFYKQKKKHLKNAKGTESENKKRKLVKGAKWNEREDQVEKDVNIAERTESEDQMEKYVQETKRTESQNTQNLVVGNKTERSNLNCYSATKGHFMLAEKQRQLNSQLNGINLVIDLKDVHKIKQKHQRKLMYSITQGLMNNARARDPFNIVLCNSNLHRMGTLGTENGDFSRYASRITEKSYLDLFPKRKLVYLSADAKGSTTVRYDPRITYIIGGLPMEENEQISLARAKKDGIHAQEIPLRTYFRHIKSARSLPVDEVITVMLSLKANDGLYKEAFQSILSTKVGVQKLNYLLHGYFESLKGGVVTEQDRRIADARGHVDLQTPKNYEFRLRNDS